MAAARAPVDASMRFVILHGKDSFGVVGAIRALEKDLASRFGDVTRFEFDGASAQLVEVLDELRTFGLLATHKLVVVDKAEQFVASEERRRALERYAEQPMQEATLVLRSESWRPGNLDKLVAKVGAVVKFEPPAVADAKGWCARRAKDEYGFELEPAACEALVERVGGDLGRLDSELAKYGCYLASEPAGARRATKALVHALTGQTREEAAWEVQEAVLAGARLRAIRKVRELVEISQAPEQLILWSLVDLARKLHDAARMLAEGEPESAVARQVKLWGPSTAPTLQAARRLGPVRAARLFGAAVDLDRRSKSGLAGELPRTLEAFAADFSARLAAPAAARR
jgi:DNA polymerase-3 subunit delta